MRLTFIFCFLNYKRVMAVTNTRRKLYLCECVCPERIEKKKKKNRPETENDAGRETTISRCRKKTSHAGNDLKRTRETTTRTTAVAILFGRIAASVRGLCALWIRAAGTLPRSFGCRVFPLVYRRGVPARGVSWRRDAGASQPVVVVVSHTRNRPIHPRCTTPRNRNPPPPPPHTHNEWTHRVYIMYAYNCSGYVIVILRMYLRRKKNKNQNGLRRVYVIRSIVRIYSPTPVVIFSRVHWTTNRGFRCSRKLARI